MNIINSLLDEFVHYGASNCNYLIENKLTLDEILQLLKFSLKLTQQNTGCLSDFYEENEDFILSVPLLKEYIDEEYIFNQNINYSDFVKIKLNQIY